MPIYSGSTHSFLFDVKEKQQPPITHTYTHTQRLGLGWCDTDTSQDQDVKFSCCSFYCVVVKNLCRNLNANHHHERCIQTTSAPNTANNFIHKVDRQLHCTQQVNRLSRQQLTLSFDSNSSSSIMCL